MSTKDTHSHTETKHRREYNLTRDMVLNRIDIFRWMGIRDISKRLFNKVGEGEKSAVKRIINELVLLNLVEVKGKSKGTKYRRIQSSVLSRRENQGNIRGMDRDGHRADKTNSISLDKLTSVKGVSINFFRFYLKLSRFKFEGVSDVAMQNDVPLASAYRQLKAMKKLGIVIEGDRGLTGKGKRFERYKRRYRYILIDENGVVYFVNKLHYG